MVVHRIVVLGDGGVGKTALTVQLCLNQFVETYDPTIEDSYNKQVVIDDIPCNLEVLDTAGQEEYTALRDQWIRDGQGFLIVYSITSRETFYRIERFRDQIMRVKDTDDSIPMILVGNKCDRNGEREVSREEGQALALRLQCDFIETSAKTRINVERAFYNVVRALRREQELETRIKTSRSIKRTTELANQKKKDEKKGCVIM